MRIPVSAVPFLLAFAVAPSSNALDGERKVFAYKKVDSRELKLFVTSPAGADRPAPAIVFFHGGGWTGGTPAQFDQQAAHFASRGMVAVQVEYRLLDRNGTEPPVVCIQDARSALRWVRAHAAELNVDPRRIASAGGSAGGHLAAVLGTMDGIDDPKDDLSVSARSNAMVLFNPVFDNGPEGWGHQRAGARYKEFSPYHNIGASMAPAIVMAGTQDKLLPAATVNGFCDKARKAGARCEVRLYDGQPHGFFNYRKDGDNTYDTRTLEAADNFLISLGWLPSRPSRR